MNHDSKQNQTQHEDMIVTEDNNARGKFIRTILISGISGGALSLSALYLTRMVRSMEIEDFFLSWDAFQIRISYIAHYLLILLILLYTLICTIYYRHTKKLYLNGNDEDEDESYYEMLDKRLSKILSYSSAAHIVSFFLFGASTYGMANGNFGEHNTLFTFTFFFFLLGAFIINRFNQLAINLTKRINPEKRGSVLDTKFHKTWLDSCDEAEQAIIYKSAYKAYSVTQKTCTGLIVIFIFVGMSIRISLVPLTIVTFILLVLNLSYLLSTRKYNAGNNIERNEEF